MIIILKIFYKALKILLALIFFNGKKTIPNKLVSLYISLKRLEKNKKACKINEAFSKNNIQIQFIKFSDLLLHIKEFFFYKSF